MPTYEFQCKDGHVTDHKLSFDEISDVPYDSEGRQYILCPVLVGHGELTSNEDGEFVAPLHTCNKPSFRGFTSSHAVYNAHGFYGSLGTDVAHNCGTVH